MRIGTDEGIGEGHRFALLFFRHNDRGEILQVHLVNDTGARRHHAEIAEGLLSPAEQGVTLAVTFVLALYIAGESEG